MRIGRVERIYIEGEENGWELVIETDDGETFRANVHGIASSGDLAVQLDAIRGRLDDWRAGA